MFYEPLYGSIRLKFNVEKVEALKDKKEDSWGMLSPFNRFLHH